MPIIPALGGQRQEDHKIKGYVARLSQNLKSKQLGMGLERWFSS